jgi:tetratricopeptide (TPR) repeat protein
MGKLGDIVKRTLTAPIRALLPKNPWLRVLVYALPILLVLALFQPALDVLLKLLDFVLRVIEPLLQTTLGRILLLLVVFTLGAVVAVWLLKSRVRDLRAEAALGRHLHAVAALVDLDGRRARELLKKVARYRGPLPERYPHLCADANLKLARGCLQQGQVEPGLGWLARIVEPGLPDELLRSLRQLRIEALRRQGGVLPLALRREVESAVEQFPSDHVLLGELRDLVAHDGDPAALAEAQERVHKASPPALKARERQRWLAALVEAGQHALRAADRDQVKKIAKKLLQVDKDGPSSGLLLGDLHRSAGDLRAAIKAYGGTRSPAGLDRIAEVLAAHPGCVEPRELVECCPLQGALLLVARELARRGELERAERAARVAAEALGPTPTVCAVLAEVLTLLGKEEQARLLREQAVVRLLGAAGGSGADAD